ncbi:MAG: HD-GYP domain-containing protein [Phycisphaerales bacterium]
MDRHAIEPRSEQPAPIAARSAWMTVEPRDLAHHVSMAAAVSAPEANSGFDHLVDELVAQVDATDPRQAGHSHRVSVLATMLGSSLGMDQRELRDLRAAALLHDVGKILVPTEILRKDGPLSVVEAAAVRRHGIYGGSILRRIPALAFAAPAARWHHERWDGIGYPDGLAGNAIPLFARIVAVADALDAMTSVRPYREAISMQEAFMELEEQSGAQFDPLVVSALGPLVGAPGFEAEVAEVAGTVRARSSLSTAA